MESPLSNALRTVLILKVDRVCAEIIEAAAQRILPEAMVASTGLIAEARLVLGARGADFLITGASARDGDVLGLLGETLSASRVRRTFVITTRHDQRILTALRALPIRGIFDPAAEGLRELDHALHVVASGGEYWSATVIDRLRQLSHSPQSLCRLLSRTEELVLAIIGDGCDDATAAATLGLKPSTILSIRRDLHRKLHVQHKGDLMKAATQAGYVCLTPEAVLRPGFATLLAEFNAQRGGCGEHASTAMNRSAALAKQ